MKKALSYRLFGLGRVPRKWRLLIEQEGILVADEGMPGWFIAHNVKGPGKRYWRRAEGFSGCLVVTLQRILCFTYWKCQINIATQDPRLSALHVSVPSPNRLSLSFESAAFRPGWQGVVEYRFGTVQAQAFRDMLTGLGVRSGAALATEEVIS
jgi:hypothetical protein